MKSFVPPPFYRLAGDHSAYFGDDGTQDLFYPVYFNPKLAISDATKGRLFSDLQTLHQLRRDVQKNGVTEDIIDPDLAPRRRQDVEYVIFVFCTEFFVLISIL